MDALKTIDRYYAAEPELRALLITHSRCVADLALLTARRYVEAHVAEIAAGTLKAPDMQVIETGAMLHDLGIIRCHAPGIHCHGTQPYICHGTLGAEMLRSETYDESAHCIGPHGKAEKEDMETYARICERHTGSGLTGEEIERQALPLEPRDLLPETIEEKIICYADKFYSKSGDATQCKSAERVDASMRKFGEASWQRWLQLKEEIK